MNEAPEYRAEGIEIRCPDCGGFHAAPEDAGFDKLVHDACLTVSPMTQWLYDEYRIAEPEGQWATDREAGTLTFSHSDGARASARYDLVGSWRDTDNTFVWGWDLPQRTPATGGAARALRDYGAEHGHDVLTAKMLRLGEQDTWHMARIAAFIAQMPGVYRAQVADSLWAYFAFAEPEWENQ